MCAGIPLTLAKGVLVSSGVPVVVRMHIMHNVVIAGVKRAIYSSDKSPLF